MSATRPNTASTTAEWRRAIRFETEVSLVLLDIDPFKLFNDTYGHHAGGEEFAIILGGTDAAGAVNIAERTMARMNDFRIPHRTSPTSPQITIGIGAATTFVAVGMSEAELIKAADGTLYRAKAGGRNRIAV